MFPDTKKRPWGAAKQTEEYLAAVPLPRAGALRHPPIPLPTEAQQGPSPEQMQDPRGTNPYMFLSPEDQLRLSQVKAWYEVAASDFASPVTQQIAKLHLDELMATEPKADSSGYKQQADKENGTVGI